MLSPPESGPGTTRRPGALTTFTGADGRPVRVVPGFRDRVLGFRPSVTPRPGWTAADYERAADKKLARARRSEEHTSELQSQSNLVCRLLLEKKKEQTATLDRADQHPGVLSHASI